MYKIPPAHYNVSDRPLNDYKTLLKNSVDNPPLAVRHTFDGEIYVVCYTKVDTFQYGEG